MASAPLDPRHRLFLFLLCLLFLAKTPVSRAGLSRRDYPTRHHARVSRTFKARSPDSRYGQTRHTKFSDWGILGIRNTPSTAKIGRTFIGMIPDAGDTGGAAQTMQEITQSLQGKRPACFGWYAQVEAGKTFDGAQLLEVLDDLKNSQSIFNPAIMPPAGWVGLKYSDDHQAVAIAKVLRKFTDQGIPTIVRFAHEANWYQRTGEYTGTVRDYLEAWDVFAQRVRTYCPDCLLHWTPNVANMKEYQKYEPYNFDKYVDVVGIDYYPKSKPKPGEFVKLMKEFHDKYAVNGRKFAIGETGLHYAGSMQERVDWLVQMATSTDQLPNLVYITWYNSIKEFDYKIAGKGESTKLLTEKLA